MQCTISNYRGLASASLDLSRICLLAGPNEAGKTSASQAVAAALTGEPIPINGVKKTQAGLLVRSGTANGSVELTGPNGVMHIGWPGAKVKTEGQAPFASHFAAGMASIVNLDDKERVKVLTDYLKAVPTRADLDKQLASMKLPVAVLDQLWDLITKQGWDNAASQIKEKGARLKGQWENITGDRYGSKKGDSWIPEGYDNDLMGQSEATLAGFVSDSRDSLEAAIATDAVDDSRRADLEALAALLPGRKIDLLAAENSKPDPALQHQLDECNQHTTHLSGKLDELKQALAALPQPGKKQTGMACPHCKTELQLSGGKLVKLPVADVSDEENASRKTAIEEMESKIKSVESAIRTQQDSAFRMKGQIQDEATQFTVRLNECKRLVSESEAAEKELSTPVSSGPSGISVDDCRTTLATAEKRLAAFKAKHEADRLHVAIGNNAELLAKIVPEGIRGDVLAKALKSFNDSMVRLSTAASWRPVALESDFMPTYGGTIYLLLSESAKFRVRVILQLAMALMDKSEAVIIDAADILDKGGRNGLFKTVKACGLSALVSMTIDTKEQVPNLAAAKLGCSYWLAAGVAEPIA